MTLEELQQETLEEFEGNFCVDGGEYWHRHMEALDEKEQISDLKEWLSSVIDRVAEKTIEAMKIENKHVEQEDDSDCSECGVFCCTCELCDCCEQSLSDIKEQTSKANQFLNKQK